MAITTKTEFVSSEFETSVTNEDVQSFIRVLEICVANLRRRIRDDDTVENLLDPAGSRYQLRSGMSDANQDPEPLTQETVIEPLLEELGYSDLITEVSGSSSRRKLVADYSYRVDDERIDSEQLLVEAEPMNKPIENRGHGIDQVESWLSQREFNSDFGFATDGLRWVFIRYDPDSYSHDRLADISLESVCLRLFYNLTGPQEDPIEAISNEELGIVEDFLRSFSRGNFQSIAIDAPDVIRKTQESISDEFYSEYIRLVFGVRHGQDRSPRSLVGDGVVPPNKASGEDTRLFAVKVMNRLIFVKFLEDKGIVDSDLLNDLNETYGEGKGYTASLYKSLIEPLFFDVMNWKPDDRSKHVQNVDEFQSIPYLNGGLFRPSLGEKGLDEREFDVENSVLRDVITLLEKYEFSAEGGPTDLDPSVLGNVFEKTINYLTTEPGDKNKELGAYFTPKEITRFSAEKTVRPALLDQFKNHLIQEMGWSEQEVGYDSVYELIGDLPDNTSLITKLLSEVVDELRVVDPACGSGHFLTSVLEEIVNVRLALHRRTGWNTSEHRLKKETVQNNIYGVDIVGPAVEIAKLRLWLSVISEVTSDEIDELSEGELALPNIAFNLRQGNSLIGFTGFPETTEDGDGYKLGAFEEDSVRRRYEEIISEIRLYERKGWEAEPDEAEVHRQKAFELIENARVELISDLHRQFKAIDADITQERVESYDPFHWVLEFAEVYSEGGFDVIVGNPPWDRLKPLRDDFFSRYDPIFRVRPPDEKNQIQKDLLSNQEIADSWDDYQDEMKIRSEYFKNSPAYNLQRPEIDGRVKPNPNNLASLFFERVFELANDDSHVAQILPGMVFNGASGKDLRTHLMDNTKINILAIFENHGIFGQIHYQYKFGVIVFENGGTTEYVDGTYQEGNIDVLNDYEDKSIKIPKEVLELYSPEANIFPYIGSEEKLNVLKTIIKNPPLGSDAAPGGSMEPYQGLRRTSDSDRFVDKSEADYPVYGGKNIHQYTYTPDFVEDIDPPEFWSVDPERDPERSAKRRIQEKTIGHLKKAIYEEFDGTGSQKKYVDDLLEKHRGTPLSEEDVRLDCTSYRIAFRRVARSTDERTLIATVLPKGIVCHNTLLPIRNFRIEPDEEGLSKTPLHDFYKKKFTDKELFLKVGMLNSLPFDYLLRTKIDTDIATYKFKESQLPPIDENNPWFDYIWIRSARLNAYGEEFSEIRNRLGDIQPVTEINDRKRLRAEIDAATFHAYGLDREETEFVLEDFHKVRNPRTMTNDYFDLVLEKYCKIENTFEHG